MRAAGRRSGPARRDRDRASRALPPTRAGRLRRAAPAAVVGAPRRLRPARRLLRVHVGAHAGARPRHRDARGGGCRDRRVRRAARRARQVALRGPRGSGRRSAARGRRRAAAAAPGHWDELAAGLRGAIGDLPTTNVPYRGSDEWSIIVLLLIGGLLGVLAAWLAFAHAGRAACAGRSRRGRARRPVHRARGAGRGRPPVAAGDRARGPAVRVPAPRARRAPRRGHRAGRRRGRRPRRRRRGAQARRRPTAPGPRGAGQRAGSRPWPAVLVEPRLRRAALAAHRSRGAAHQGEDGELLEGREPVALRRAALGGAA